MSNKTKIRNRLLLVLAALLLLFAAVLDKAQKPEDIPEDTTSPYETWLRSPEDSYDTEPDVIPYGQ